MLCVLFHYSILLLLVSSVAGFSIHLLLKLCDQTGKATVGLFVYSVIVLLFYTLHLKSADKL